MRKVFIYGLADPRNNQLRYIGKTVDTRKRLKDHVRAARCGEASHCYNWIRQLIKARLYPKMHIVEVATESTWIERERYWISHFRELGLPITNITDGGEGVLGLRHSPETRRKLSEIKKGRKLSDEHREAMRGKTPHNKIGALNCADCGRWTEVHSNRLCPACYQAARIPGRIRGGMGVRQRMKTHCVRGHAYDEANTRYLKNGARDCLACWTVRGQLRRERERIARERGEGKCVRCGTPTATKYHCDTCRERQKERDRLRRPRKVGKRVVLKIKTHCKRGHAFDEANTYYLKSGYRQCRACNKERGDGRRERDRALGRCPSCGGKLTDKAYCGKCLERRRAWDKSERRKHPPLDKLSKSLRQP